MRESDPVPSASAELPCLIAPANAGPMGVDPLRAVLPLLGDILVECRMVVADAQGHVVGEDTARHRFTSAAAPIRDPETGVVVGAVDVTGPSRTVHPTTTALLLAAARLAEGLLRA